MKNKVMSIRLTDGSVHINERLLSPPISIENLADILECVPRKEEFSKGKPMLGVPATYRWSWDDFGISAGGCDSSAVSYLRIFFSDQNQHVDYPAAAHYPFSGSISLSGVEHDSSEVLDNFITRLLRDKKGKPFRLLDKEGPICVEYSTDKIGHGIWVSFSTDGHPDQTHRTGDTNFLWVNYHFPQVKNVVTHSRDRETSSTVSPERPKKNSIFLDETKRMLVRWFWRGGWFALFLIATLLAFLVWLIVH